MKRPRVKTLLITTAVLALAGVIAIAWYQREQRRVVYSDAQTIHAPIELVTPRDVLWKPAEALAGAVNTQGDDYEPAITRDGLTLFFVRGRAAYNTEIYTSVRTPDGWTEPAPLEAVNSIADELGPEPSPDGRSLYFYSDRAGGQGGYDLWVAHRTDEGWSEPINLGPDVNSPAHDYGPCLSPDGGRLYFASDRIRPHEQAAIDAALADGATVESERVDYDLYESIALESGFGDTRPVVELNTLYNEGAPAFSSAGDFLYFSSDRFGGHGGFDLYRARRLDGEFRVAVVLDDAINSAANELDPSVDLRGFGLYFSSDRVVDDERAEATGPYNLYYAESREVFADTETWRATIDWLALLLLILPYLIWLLLLGLLTAILARVLHQMQYNRMNLLTKCLLGSLIAHLILLALLGMWSVSTQLANSLRPAGSMRVVISSPSVGSDIASQVRGEMTNVEVNAESVEASRQAVETDTVEPEVSEADLAVDRTEIETPDTPTQMAQANEAQSEPLESPDPTRPDDVEEIPPSGAATPTEVQQIASREAARPTPNENAPSAARAAESTLESEVQPIEVATNVNQADAAAQSTQTMAQAQQTDASTAQPAPVQPTPLEVAQQNDAPVQVAIAPVVKAAQTGEAQRQVNTAAESLSRQEASESTSAIEAQRQETAIAPAPSQTDLATDTMAQQVAAQSAPITDTAMPDASSRATPNAAQSAVALNDLPQATATRSSEAVNQVQPIQTQTARSDEGSASTMQELAVSEVAYAPQQSRLTDTGPAITEVQSVDAQAATLSAAPSQLDAARVADASSAMDVQTPIGDTPQPASTSEATGRLHVAAATASRSDSPTRSQSTPTSTAAVVNTNPGRATDAALDGNSMARASSTEASARDAVLPESTPDAGAIASDQPALALQVDVPDDAASGAPATEQGLETLAATSHVANARQGVLPEARPDSPDARVAVSSSASTLNESTDTLARMTESDATPNQSPTGAVATPPTPTQMMPDALALNVPTDRDEAAIDAPHSASSERQMQSLMATAPRSNGRAELMDAASSSEARGVEVDLAPDATRLAANDQSLASSRLNDQARPTPLAMNTDAARRATVDAMSSFDVSLPASPVDAPSTARATQTDSALLAQSGRPDARREQQLRPLATVAASADIAPADVAYELNRDSLARNLLTNADGVSSTPSRQLNSTLVEDGLVIPDAPDFALPGLEQQAPGQNAEGERRLAGRDAPTDRSRRNDMLFAANRVATGVDRIGAAPTASLDTLAAPMFAARLPGATGVEHLSRIALETVPDLDRASTVRMPDLQLNLPLEQLAATNPYVQRDEQLRDTMVEMMGGSEETEEAVKAALDWLARHQSRDGSWDGDDFDAGCNQCDGEARVEVDIGLTGLALLCFLAADHTHMDEGPYQDTVMRGLRWLLNQQRRDGSLLSGESMYSHGIATIALAEAYGMTADPVLSDPVQRSVDFIYAARNKTVGGWRYGPGQVGDTSVLGWQIMALKSAEKAGIDVPEDAFRVAARWIDLVGRDVPRGQYRYQPDGEITPAMCAEGMFVNQLLGADRNERKQRDTARYILDRLPEWDDCNVYYWYYATLAMFQHQGDEWKQWNEVVSEVLIDNQRTSGLVAGSWDPEGQWASIGGRVYQTAISTLILEVYYRYLPSFVGDDVPDRNAIRGRVYDGSTGQPLPGASVRLNLGEGRDVDAPVDMSGRYTLLMPEVPPFIAISASREGYTPISINIAAREVEGQTLVRDFALLPVRGDVVAMELEPDVHHLGNNEFTGRINSQFQKESEGLVYERTFMLTEAQLVGAVGDAEVRMLIRGVEARDPIRINGQTLDESLRRAPRDGSFGEFATTFPVEWLRPGENTIEIESVRGNSDLDDFEFVNVQIVLNPD